MKPVLVLVCVLAATPLAHAQDAPPNDKVAEAKRFFDAGRQAYEVGQYLVAATAFEEAYRLAPRPPVAFSMAQAYRRQYFVDRDPQKLKRAYDLYKQYVADVPQAGRRDDALQYIGELEPLLMRIEDDQKKKGMGPVQAMEPRREATQLMVSSRTKGARASVDGGPAAEAPLIRDVKPGQHKIRVEAPGHFPEDIEGTAVDGRLVAVEVNLREQPAILALRTSDGAEVSVDGRPVATTPLGRPLELPAGRHFVAVSKRGHRAFSRELVLERGKTTSLAAPLETTTQRKAAYVVLGAAGLALLAGGASTTLALVHEGKAEDILDAKGRGPISQAELDEYNDERSARDDYRDASYFLYGGAAALLATSALLYFIDAPRVEAPPEPALSPTVTTDGTIGLSYSRRF